MLKQLKHNRLTTLIYAFSKKIPSQTNFLFVYTMYTNKQFVFNIRKNFENKL